MKLTASISVEELIAQWEYMLYSQGLLLEGPVKLVYKQVAFVGFKVEIKK